MDVRGVSPPWHPACCRAWAGGSPMAAFARFIYVVAKDRQDLYEALRAEVAWQSDVVIVLDRRREARRRDDAGSPVDLRRTKRRQQPELDAELETVGYFITSAGRLALVEVP